MYAILDNNDIVRGFDDRGLPLIDIAPTEIHYLYVATPDNLEIHLGDHFNRATYTWDVPEASNVPVVEPTPVPYQPTNAEIAQMISDLYADLVIGGVI